MSDPAGKKFFTDAYSPYKYLEITGWHGPTALNVEVNYNLSAGATYTISHGDAYDEISIGNPRLKADSESGTTMIPGLVGTVVIPTDDKTPYVHLFLVLDMKTDSYDSTGVLIGSETHQMYFLLLKAY
jgi:hypothetical protein